MFYVLQIAAIQAAKTLNNIQLELRNLKIYHCAGTCWWDSENMSIPPEHV